VGDVVRVLAILAAMVVGLAWPVPGLALPFGNPVNVSNTSGASRQPHIALDAGGTVHVAFADDTGNPGNYRILYKRSFDQGQTFTEPIQVSTGTGAALRPRLALRGAAVYIVWHEDVSATKDILFARSLNGGASFEAPVNVSSSAAQSQEGRIAVGPGGTIFVVWDEVDAGISIARSFNGGATFESPRALFPVTMTRNCTVGGPIGGCTPYPGVVVNPLNGQVYLVWHDGPGTSFQIQFSRSLDDGATFSAPQTLTSGGLHSHCVGISMGPSGRIHIAYEFRKQQTPHRHDSLYIQSVDGGLTFSPPVNLSNGPAAAFSDYPWPSEGQNGLIVVGWEDNSTSGGLDAVVGSSTDGGQSFTPMENISNNGGSTSTELATVFGPDGTLYVVWEDYDSGNGEVLLRAAVGVGGGAGPARLLATGAGPGGGPHVRLFNAAAGMSAVGPGFFAYDPGFLGGVTVAMADLDGDGVAEVVTGAGPGGGPHVRIFKVDPATGAVAALGPGFLAYDVAFRGGVRVAARDVDGDGRPEIITGTGPGGGPHVRVFKVNPTTGDVFPLGLGFFAYAPGFTGGVSVAAE
jgi:hypothetical protein